MIVGVDIDGVVARDPWSFYRRELFAQYGVLGKVARIICIFIDYILRPPFSETKVLLEKYKKRGGKIIFISGIPKLGKPIIWLWLKVHRIHFDKLVLRGREDVVRFKARAIIENQCTQFIEDQLKLALLIKYLLQEMSYTNNVEVEALENNCSTFYLLKLKI
ncbi:MAG: hypothetical protein LR000_00245 [Candidatus Pacebacteria bacterium]|nr:hypothetical protein [Candidatus Paceibacterota bacterium]